MVGSSFVGELSVDIGEILRIDRDVYYDMVSLWAPVHWSGERKRELVDESFRGAGTDTFVRDHSTLDLVDPMRVDMCNISFHGVHEHVPLPPATDTIGSDYFLIHLVHDAALPGVLHNRNIVNFYTGERRTDAGFTAYQMRYVKFLLSMLYFNVVYDGMAEAGPELTDERGQVRASVIARLVSESTRLDRAENVQRLDALDTAYRKLGGAYAEFADLLADAPRTAPRRGPQRHGGLRPADRGMGSAGARGAAHPRTHLTGAAGVRAASTHESATHRRPGVSRPGVSPRPCSPHWRPPTEDRIVFDLTGIEDRYDTLRRELPGVLVRFAMKACPVDEVLAVPGGEGRRRGRGEPA